MDLPRDPIARRRLGALALAATAALLLGVVAGAGNSDGESTPPAATPVPGAVATPSASERSAPRRLKPSQLAGHAVILRFAGTKAPAYVRRVLRRGRAAGVILFRDNMPTQASTRALTAALQRAGKGRALISTDQEGGTVRNLPWAAPPVGQPALGDTRAATAAARAAARDLHGDGINVNLAPVADLGGAGPVMRGRAFPGGSAAVARLTAASVRGYRGSRVAPTVKHFPGLGAAAANTDDAPTTIDLPARRIGAEHLPPFKAAIAAGVPIVMVGHARYPALDRDAIASQSKPVVTGLLRGGLGFRGVAMTDSLEAKAVTVDHGPERAAVRSVRAGIDLVLTTGRGSYLRVRRALAAEARRDPAFRTRMAEAAARVIALQRSLAA